MSKRSSWTEEQRAAERVKNRERMRRLSADPAYRDRANARRKARDAERKEADPELRARLHATKKRYYRRRKDDPDFKRKRTDYLKRWQAERRLNEQFDAFVARLEAEGAQA